MQEERQTDTPDGPAEWQALAKRWAAAYGFEWRELPSLKMVEVIDPELGFPLADAIGEFPGVYRKFVESVIELTKAGNVEGLKVQIDLQEAKHGAS